MNMNKSNKDCEFYSIKNILKDVSCFRREIHNKGQCSFSFRSWQNHEQLITLRRNQILFDNFFHIFDKLDIYGVEEGRLCLNCQKRVKKIN